MGHVLCPGFLSSKTPPHRFTLDSIPIDSIRSHSIPFDSVRFASIPFNPTVFVWFTWFAVRSAHAARSVYAVKYSKIEVKNIYGVICCTAACFTRTCCGSLELCLLRLSALDKHNKTPATNPRSSVSLLLAFTVCRCFAPT